MQVDDERRSSNAVGGGAAEWLPNVKRETRNAKRETYKIHATTSLPVARNGSQDALEGRLSNNEISLLSGARYEIKRTCVPNKE